MKLVRIILRLCVQKVMVWKKFNQEMAWWATARRRCMHRKGVVRLVGENNNTTTSFLETIAIYRTCNRLKWKVDEGDCAAL